MSAGSIRERAPGVWQIRVYAGLDPITCKKRWSSATIHGGRRAAEKKRAELVANLERVSSSGLVRHAVDAWLVQKRQQGLSANTMPGYERRAARIRADLGHLRLDKVDVPILEQWLASFKVAPSTVRHYHHQLTAILDVAVRYGWLATNPSRLARGPKVRDRQSVPPAVDAVARALAAAGTDELGVAFALLAGTGCRRGEVCGLMWDDWQPETRRLTIRRAVAHQGRGLVVQGTKTDRARTVTVPPQLAALLEEWRRRMTELPMQESFAHSFILADERSDGTVPWRPDRLTLAWRRLAARHGVTGRLHDLRHLHASLLLAGGRPVPEVAARLGHSTPATTMRVYAHMLAGADDEAADLIDAAFHPTPGLPVAAKPPKSR